MVRIRSKSNVNTSPAKVEWLPEEFPLVSLIQEINSRLPVRIFEMTEKKEEISVSLFKNKCNFQDWCLAMVRESDCYSLSNANKNGGDVKWKLQQDC